MWRLEHSAGRVQKGSHYEPVIVKPSLPNYTEQEIIVVDLMPDKPTENPPAEKFTPLDELDWWAKCSEGVIDPRPRAMVMVREEFDRILQNGGAFIIFSDRRDKQDFVFAKHYKHHGLSITQELNYDKWSFLSILSNLSISHDHRISIGFSVDFDEQPVDSLRLNDADVQCATVGNEVGILRDEVATKLKAGLSVYRIKSE